MTCFVTDGFSFTFLKVYNKNSYLNCQKEYGVSPPHIAIRGTLSHILEISLNQKISSLREFLNIQINTVKSFEF